MREINFAIIHYRSLNLDYTYRGNSKKYNKQIMFPFQKSQLKDILVTVVKGGQDLVLYGPKSCGKTLFAQEILSQALGGNQNYIHIKGMLVHSRNCFLTLFNEGFVDLINHLGNQYLANRSSQLTSSTQDDVPLSLTKWLKEMNDTIHKHEVLLTRMKRIHVLVDNIEQLQFKENFFCRFYQACKKNLDILKISFFFTGMNHPQRWMADQEPYRCISSFFMPKPHLDKIISQFVQEQFKEKNPKNPSEYKKLCSQLKQVLFHSFESMEYSIDSIKKTTKQLMKATFQFIKTDPKNIPAWLDSEELYKMIKKFIQFGPVTSERLLNQNLKKDLGIQQILEGQQYFIHQGYPNLIQSSIFLANGYTEDSDRFRFKDYHKSSRKQKNNLKRRGMASSTFKKQEKNIQHNMQRIISIAQVLQEQSNTNFLAEKFDKHHNLDFYGCFDYLRDEGRLHMYGLGNRAYGGKIYAEVKESEVKDYFKFVDIKYSEFVQQ